MKLFIDDSYGPISADRTRYVTSARRSHIAIEFIESDIDYYNNEIRKVIHELNSLFRIVGVTELHFADIYQRKNGWENVSHHANLVVFEFFAFIYQTYKWKVHIQTIDERTLLDHRIKNFTGKLGCFDLSKSYHLSLILLLFKIKHRHESQAHKLSIIIDEGIQKPNYSFKEIIDPKGKWLIEGKFESSKNEPLLQIADFIAFSVNRNTYLQTKKNKTDTDIWFMNLLGEMSLNSPDSRILELDIDSTIDDFDYLHYMDRQNRGFLNP